MMDRSFARRPWKGVGSGAMPRLDDLTNLVGDVFAHLLGIKSGRRGDIHRDVARTGCVGGSKGLRRELWKAPRLNSRHPLLRSLHEVALGHSLWNFRDCQRRARDLRL